MISIGTKEKIIKEARYLFEVYGYKKTSMDEIAKKSNVTKKTVYSYFKDKENLLNEIIELEFLNIKKEVDKKRENDNEIISFVKETTLYLLHYKNNSKLLNNLMKEKNELISITTKIDKEIIDYIKERLLILKEKQPNLVFDLDFASFIIYKLFIAIIFEWNKEINEKEVINNITKILESGLLSEE